MASVTQEPEILLAQRLAANEKSNRTKALKTLRKYINLRSQKIEGGFTNDDLMKIWKGLFYCLWMQDKPVLQEELSERISGLIHNFHTLDSQMLYFETFLQTLKREWNGIDRLRLDKFYQLVRFVFRQTFEVLKRTEWDSSAINNFLEIITAHLLQNTGRVADGLLFHILELYMTELARAGSAELTAEQNLTFIDPFCRGMAKTKAQSVLASISKNIFSTIMSQACFAVEDLMKELGYGEDDSDSGQASEEDGQSVEEEEQESKAFKKAKSAKVNGIVNAEQRDENSEDELLDVDDVDPAETPGDDIGPVLQFDYGAIADRLFELGSRLNTPNANRAKMYSLVKIFRDLSEGIFTQDEEDAVKGPKNKKNKKRRYDDLEDDEYHPNKKRKANVRKLSEPDQDGGNVKKKKKKKGKEKHEEMQTTELNTEISAENLVEADGTSLELNKMDPIEGTPTDASEVESTNTKPGPENDLEASGRKKRTKGKKLKSKLQEVVGEIAVEHEITLGNADKESHMDINKGVTTSPEIEMLEDVASGTQKTTAPPSGRKKGGQKSKRNVSEDLNLTECTNEMILNVPHVEDITASTPAKKKRKCATIVKDTTTTEANPEVKALKDCSNEPKDPCSPSCAENSLAEEQPKGSASAKRRKQKVKKVLEEGKAETESDVVIDLSKDSQTHDQTKDIPSATIVIDADDSIASIAFFLKKKKNKKQKEKETSVEINQQVDTEVKEPQTANDEPTVQVCKPKRPKKKKEKQISSEEKEPEVDVEAACTTQKNMTGHPSSTPIPQKKKKKTKKDQKMQMVDLEVDVGPSSEAADEPVLKKKSGKKQTAEAETLETDCSLLTPLKRGKKKRKLQIRKADTAQINGDVKEVAEISTPRKKVSSKPAFASFPGQTKAPTPLFFFKVKPKSSPSTPLSSIKIFQTSKSETKKVTFGLKNNKTTEFRKTDQSLLVSPVGSSRVAFDPKKKPTSSVLKSPASSPSVRGKKNTPMRRATAADFF